MKHQRIDCLEQKRFPKSPKVSIIIPFYYRRTKCLTECLAHCSSLDYPNFEVIVVSNKNFQTDYPKVRVVVTDKISQGEKDDVGIEVSNGEICAFIGDDVYPRVDWLTNAVKYFELDYVGAVEGPGVTPPNDSIMQQASGVVYSSPLGGGFERRRYIPTEQKFVDDCHATNLLVRRSILKKVGGFGMEARYRSGEDTILSSKISKLGKKMIYAPDVVVFHHRRPLFRGHARQVYGCGLHRGYFFKKFCGTSRRFPYLLPSIFTLALPFAFMLALVNPLFKWFMIFALLAFLGAGIGSGWHLSHNIKIALLLPLGVFFSHLAYGMGFLVGLITRDEQRLMYKD